MKALSLWQPHAAAIALELKTWETRDWPTHYRGPLAIHAAKRAWDDLDAWHGEAASRLLARCGELLAAQFPEIDADHKKRAQKYLRDRVLVFGAVVCIVDLVDCVPTRDLRGRLDPRFEFWGDFSDGETGAGRYAFRLENMRLLDKPVPWLGMQRFFEVELGAELEAPAAIASPGAPMQLDLFGGGF
ncbi:MAG TPA: ASCH domain-containing protein [Terracidiphilus sp.]|nr:ASCH domain-containing protein [Terracidiphilus sp.]